MADDMKKKINEAELENVNGGLNGTDGSTLSAGFAHAGGAGVDFDFGLRPVVPENILQDPSSANTVG